MTFFFRTSAPTRSPAMRRPTPSRRLTAAAGVAVVGAYLALTSQAALAAQGPVGLGTAESFAVLAGSGITNTGPTTITGDVGTFPTPTESGFDSVTLIGTNHAGDAVTQGAKDDLVTAYNDAAGRTPTTNVPVELGGSVLLAGVYTSPTFGLTGTLTLDAQGDTDAQFIFLAGSTLITATDSRVLLRNGADPCRVVWQVGSSATFDTRTQFVGDVLALESISALTSATFQGRLLARNGAVTLDSNTITNATCAAPSGGIGTAPPTGGTTSAAIDTTPVTTVGAPSAAVDTTPVTTVAAAVPTPAATPNPVPSLNPPPTATATPGAPSAPSAPPDLARTGPMVAPLVWTAIALLGLGGVALRSGRGTGRHRRC